jgi:hypothetical protein
MQICREDICSIQEFWLITNTKFTTTAQDYGQCVGIKMLSWDFPKHDNLHDRIQRAGLYPITVLQEITAAQAETLIAKDIIVCRDLLEKEHLLRHLHLSTRKHEAIMQEARLLCSEK